MMDVSDLPLYTVSFLEKYGYFFIAIGLNMDNYVIFTKFYLDPIYLGIYQYIIYIFTRKIKENLSVKSSINKSKIGNCT